VNVGALDSPEPVESSVEALEGESVGESDGNPDVDDSPDSLGPESEVLCELVGVEHAAIPTTSRSATAWAARRRRAKVMSPAYESRG
jgi:hypothetical protein